ncbi:Uncharacterised protein [uncultured archaeon]|nr:Uncharacterised protein [uncultured archaeon]
MRAGERPKIALVGPASSAAGCAAAVSLFAKNIIWQFGNGRAKLSRERLCLIGEPGRGVKIANVVIDEEAHQVLIDFQKEKGYPPKDKALAERLREFKKMQAIIMDILAAATIS